MGDRGDTRWAKVFQVSGIRAAAGHIPAQAQQELQALREVMMNAKHMCCTVFCPNSGANVI
ncbi:MAG: hypothetical protein ACKPKO_18290, partial [Candidatus Fonsibacter sp.]